MRSIGATTPQGNFAFPLESNKMPSFWLAFFGRRDAAAGLSMIGAATA
jgi:hypothetical protein